MYVKKNINYYKPTNKQTNRNKNKKLKTNVI